MEGKLRGKGALVRLGFKGDSQIMTNTPDEKMMDDGHTALAMGNWIKPFCVIALPLN